MKLSQNIKNSILFVLGSVLTALGISVFYIPNKIVTGGVSGIATVLFYALSITPSVSYFIINLVLVLLGSRYLGKSFIIKSVIGSSIVTLFIQIFSYVPTFTEDIILNSVFGSVISGFGIGLTLIAGGSTGGTDILGRLIQYKYPSASIGTAMLICDFIVIFVSLILFKNIDYALYGIVSLFIATYAINFLIRKLNVSKLAFVVSEKREDLVRELIKKSPRGITVMNVVGGYTGKDKHMIMCALKDREMPIFQKCVTDIDPEAFIIYSESEQIFGNGFQVYR